MSIKEEAEIFIEMTGLSAMKEQIATNKDIEEIQRKINLILKLIKPEVKKLEKGTKEETEPIRVKSKKKKMEMVSTGKEDRNSSTQLSGNEEYSRQPALRSESAKLNDFGCGDRFNRNQGRLGDR